MEIDFPDQVWATNITNIRLLTGFAYLVAYRQRPDKPE